MNELSSVDVVDQLYKRFAVGEWDAVEELIADDIVVQTPLSKLEGRLAVLASWRQLFSDTQGTFLPVALEISALDDGRVYSRHHSTAQMGDKKLDVHESMTCSVRDGQITYIDETFDQPELEEAFWDRSASSDNSDPD